MHECSYCALCMYRPWYLSCIYHLSKSKKFSNPQPSSKRPKIDGQIRTLRMTEIHDDIKSFKDSIKFKERRRLQAESSREYKVCEDLTVEIREHQRKIRELEAELKSYEAKEKKSKGYHRRKSLMQKSPSPLSSESEASRRLSAELLFKWFQSWTYIISSIISVRNCIISAICVSFSSTQE